MDKKTLLGSRLRELRRQAGMTQQGLAYKLNIGLRSYSDWERSKVMPPVDFLISCADFFGVSVDYLLGRSNFHTGNFGESIHAYLGLSDATIKKLHEIHSYEWETVSTKYDEQHKAIDGINAIFERNCPDILRSIFEYTASVVLPETVTIYDDTGTGHVLPAATFYRQAKIHDIIRSLDEMSSI